MIILLAILVLVVVVLLASTLTVGTRRRLRRKRAGRAELTRPPSPPPPAPPSTEVGPAAPPEARPDAFEPTPQEVPPSLLPAEGQPPSFRERLGKARGLFGQYVGSIRSRGGIDQASWDDLEEVLIKADVGVSTTASLLEDLRDQVQTQHMNDPDALVDALKERLIEIVGGSERSLNFEPGIPNVWLFVGVNGVGKTTTIGKVARRQVALGRSVVLAAGDTFRAAAADQLGRWADRVGADLVRGSEGGDPGSVVFDAVQRAASHHADLVLADTAGRLHTKVNLMKELEKIRRVADRPPGKVTEVLLVVDATTGQNGMMQARQFTDAAQVTGVVLTKLDGTARGGIVVAIQRELGVPVKLVGLGEGADDLVEFSPEDFVDAIFS